MELSTRVLQQCMTAPFLLLPLLTTHFRSQMESGCEPADVPALTPYANGTGYTLTGTWSGCSATFEIPSSSPIQFAAEPLLLSTCAPTSEILPGAPQEPQFLPIVFFVYDATGTGGNVAGGSVSSGNANAAMAFCKPSMKIYYVDVQVDLVTQALLSVTITGNYTGVNDVTGGTLQGRPLNGYALVFILSRISLF